MDWAARGPAALAPRTDTLRHNRDVDRRAAPAEFLGPDPGRVAPQRCQLPTGRLRIRGLVGHRHAARDGPEDQPDQVTPRAMGTHQEAGKGIVGMGRVGAGELAAGRTPGELIPSPTASRVEIPDNQPGAVRALAMEAIDPGEKAGAWGSCRKLRHRRGSSPPYCPLHTVSVHAGTTTKTTPPVVRVGTTVAGCSTIWHAGGDGARSGGSSQPPLIVLSTISHPRH